MTPKSTIQNILSIDASVNPPQVFLFEVDGISCTLRERYSLDCEPSVLMSHRAGITDNIIEPVLQNETNAVRAHIDIAGANPFIELKTRIQSSWEYLAIVIPAKELVSLNLALPFSSYKSIGKILQGEVQEQLPLDTDAFHLHYDVQGRFRGSSSDRNTDSSNLVEVKVQLIERSAIESILALAKEAEIEPTLITTPGSLLPLALNLSGQNTLTSEKSEERSHAIIDCQDKHLTLTIFADDAYRNEYTFEIKANLSSVAAHLIRNLRWAENRYQCSIDPIYVIGLPSEREIIQSALKREVQPLLLPARVPHQELIGTLAAIAAQEDPPIHQISNLRSGAYSYNPLLTLALSQALKVFPILIVCLVTLITVASLVYGFREYQINSYHKALSEKIVSVASDLNAPAGTETVALRGRIRQFDEQLKAMSLFSELTPLDILGLVSKYIPQQKDVEMSYLSVEGKNIIMRGSAPDHATVEKVTREIKKNGRTFCKLRKQRAMKSSQKTISFEFQFEMCE